MQLPTSNDQDTGLPDMTMDGIAKRDFCLLFLPKKNKTKQNKAELPGRNRNWFQSLGRVENYSTFDFDVRLCNRITSFFISNTFFRLKCCLAKFEFIQNWPTLPGKKVFKMLVRKSAIIWQRSWSLVLNIFRDLCFGVGQSQARIG